MKLLIWVAKNEIKELDKNNIKVVFLGEEDRLSSRVLKAMADASERTKNNDGGTLLICINYGGQQEIATAINKILINNPGIKEVTPDLIRDNLYSPNVPDVDLVIRTSGEHRISNFMLWRAAYSELFFVEDKWPAFTTKHLQEAIDNYSSRQRRFGK
jgi:undecaprenyl diphosphate synthase